MASLGELVLDALMIGPTSSPEIEKPPTTANTFSIAGVWPPLASPRFHRGRPWAIVEQ